MVQGINAFCTILNYMLGLPLNIPLDITEENCIFAYSITQLTSYFITIDLKPALSSVLIPLR
jgi:hypothetical protein